MDPADDADRESLRAFLATRETPCPSCNYNLRGLTTDRCPECDQDLVLQVGLAEPRLGAYLSGLVGLAVGSGFCSIVLAWGMAAGMPSRDPGILPLLCGTVIGGALTALWLARGRSIRRWPPARLACAASACWILSGACVVLFLAVA